MLKNRPVMMLLTGIALALILWALVSRTQTPKTPVVSEPVQATGPVAVNEDYMITPPSVSSVRQVETGFILAGTGVAGAGLSLMQDVQSLATTKLDENGDWSVFLSQDGLPDVMEVNLLMTTPDGNLVRSDQSLLLVKRKSEVLEASEGSETEASDEEVLDEAPQDLSAKRLILLLAPGAHSRVLQTPYTELPGRDGFVVEAIDYDNSGGVIFSGLSLRQGKVRIYANGNLVGESSVDTTGRWSLIFGNILPMGKYDLGVELVSDTGLNSTTLTLPFERMEPMFETEGSSKVVVEHLEDRVQVARALYGGGYQFTVIYAPIVLVE